MKQQIKNRKKVMRLLLLKRNHPFFKEGEEISLITNLNIGKTARKKLNILEN
jgi:hypothetical protein